MEIKSGLYILTQDVENPSPDRRRKSSVLYHERWAKGTRWKIEDQGSWHHLKDVSVEEIRTKRPFAFYELTHYGSYDHTSLESDAGQALWQHLEKMPESVGEVLVNADLLGPSKALERTLGTVLSILVESGKVSLEDIHIAIKAYSDSDEEEFWSRLKRNGFV